MLTVKCLRDLDRYGVDLLTGEADALSYRVLCDLTKAGRDLVCEAYGIRPEGLAENWNHGSDKDPHLASIMLAHDAWRQIGPVALVKCCHTVFDTDSGTIFGLQDGEEFHQAEYEGWGGPGPLKMVTPPKITRDGRTMQWPSTCYGKPGRFYRFGSGPRVGTRNVHAMSGRVQ